MRVRGPNNVMLEELPNRSNIAVLRFGGSCGSKVWPVSNFGQQTPHKHVTGCANGRNGTCNNVASVCTGLNWGFCLLNQLILLFLEFACPLLSQCWDSRMRFANEWHVNQRRSGRKVTSVSTNVKIIVPRPRVPKVLFSRDLTETASSESETQGQSVGSGEKVRRKF